MLNKCEKKVKKILDRYKYTIFTFIMLEGNLVKTVNN